jgi:hypothetical protein
MISPPPNNANSDDLRLRFPAAFLAVLGIVLAVGGTWLLLAWLEDTLRANATDEEDLFGIWALMLILKSIVPCVAGAFGIAFGCAAAEKWFPAQPEEISTNQ